MLPWVGVNLREFYYGLYFTVGATAVQARPPSSADRPYGEIYTITKLPQVDTNLREQF